MVHHGDNLQRAVEKLKSRIHNVEIRTAGFAVHETCSKPPDVYFYGALDSPSYEKIRDKIIDMLQRYGSLLLDTEHIEIKVRVKCSLQDFFTALAQAGTPKETVTFRSGARRINATIINPIIVDKEKLDTYLPCAASVEGVVRKCRVLELSRRDEFSIIPIFYPTIPGIIDPKWLEHIPTFIQSSSFSNATPEEIFYLVGLLAAMEILRGVSAALRKLGDKVEVEVPSPEGLSHLLSIYPCLSLDSLSGYIRELLMESRHYIHMLAKAELSSTLVIPAKEDELTETSLFLIQEILAVVEEQKNEMLPVIDENQGITAPLGMAFSEIMELAGGLNIPPVYVSAAIDRLIDEEYLVTSVERIYSSARIP